MSEKMPLESWLREAYAMPRPDCPAPEQMHGLALGDLNPAQRSSLQEHLNGCPACAAEYDMALVFESNDGGGVNASEVAEIVARLERTSPVRAVAGRRSVDKRDPGHVRVRTWFGWPRPTAGWQLAVAATFVAVLAVSAWPRPPALPSAHETAPRGTTIRTISPQGDVGAFPTQMKWQSHPQAITYRVRLVRVDDTLLWEALIADSKIDLPATVGEQLQPLVRYVWTVEALNKTGALVAASQPQSFRIRTVANPSPQGR